MRTVARLMLALLLAVLVLPPVVSAATARTDGDVIVPLSAAPTDDQYLAGNNVRIEGTVTGDVVGAARTVVVSGRVDGDVWAAGEEVEIRGTVTGSVRGFAKKITVTGTVGGDVIAAGQQIDVAGTVARDVWVAGSEIRVAGSVGRDIKVAGERIVTAGTVGGSAEIKTSDRLDLQAGTQIAGNLKYTAPEQVTPAAGAIITGKTDFTQRTDAQDTQSFPDVLFGKLYWLAASLLLLVAILLYARRAAVIAAQNVRQRPGVSFLIGLGSLVLFPLGVIFLILSAVGIPLAVFTVFFYALVAYTAKLFPALLIGQLVLQRKKLDTFWSAFGAGTVGLALFYFLTAIPILGGLVSFAALTFGIGAQSLLAFQLYKDNRKKYGV